VLTAKGKQLRFTGPGKPHQAALIELDSPAFKLLNSACTTDGQLVVI